MRKIAWLGVIFGILVVLSVFWPQYPGVARAAPDTENLWSESNTAPNLTLTDSANANGSTTSTWANAAGKWAKNFWWWEFVMADSTVNVGQINSVTLYLKHRQTGWQDDNFLIQIYDGTNWLEVQSYTTGSKPPTSDTTDSWDVTLAIDTWTKITAAKVRIFGAISNPAEDTVQWFVDTVELRIDYTPAIISITLTDGAVDYGTVAVGATEDTTASGVNDTQTATNNGNVAERFQIKSSDASGGAPWTLGAEQGSNTFTHTASIDGGSNWDIAMTAADTYYDLATSVPADGTQDFDLQIGMPTSVTDYGEHTITVIVLATQAGS